MANFATIARCRCRHDDNDDHDGDDDDDSGDNCQQQRQAQSQKRHGHYQHQQQWQNLRCKQKDKGITKLIVYFIQLCYYLLFNLITTTISTIRRYYFVSLANFIRICHISAYKCRSSCSSSSSDIITSLLFGVSRAVMFARTTMARRQWFLMGTNRYNINNCCWSSQSLSRRRRRRRRRRYEQYERYERYESGTINSIILNIIEMPLRRLPIVSVLNWALGQIVKLHGICIIRLISYKTIFLRIPAHQQSSNSDNHNSSYDIFQQIFKQRIQHFLTLCCGNFQKLCHVFHNLSTLCGTTSVSAFTSGSTSTTASVTTSAYSATSYVRDPVPVPVPMPVALPISQRLERTQHQQQKQQQPQQPPQCQGLTYNCRPSNCHSNNPRASSQLSQILLLAKSILSAIHQRCSFFHHRQEWRRHRCPLHCRQPSYGSEIGNISNVSNINGNSSCIEPTKGTPACWWRLWHFWCRCHISVTSSLCHRSLILLILLSSLWHSSECFHGSFKLSSNTVKTKYGLLRGVVVRPSPLVEAYLGIPYASPPVGSLRFMPPITPSAWKNVRNADRFSPVCPQIVPIPPNGPEALLEVPRARLAQLRRLLPLLNNQSEDCLYLNIYVPFGNRRHRRFITSSGERNDSSPRLPTILFIHGESYEWNSGNPYDGSELAAHGNVIVVTINFRLGIFGFLKTGGKESAQGNFGLMDLVAGLHWLKENLPAFGGDPNGITMLGHGSGAALANILVVSPVASDLIQRAVLVSGSALSPWAIQKNPLFVKRRVAEQTGCHGDMLYDDLAPCLRTKSVADLLAVKIDHPRFLVGFAPFVDGTVISPNSEQIGPLTLPLGSAIVSTSGIEFANFPKRDLIFCLTSIESYLDLSAQDLEFGFNETRRDRILRTFVRNNYHYHLNEIFAVLKNEYTDWEKAIRNPLSSRDATLSFLSDGHTASSLIKLGYLHSLRGGRSYFLHFKHKTIEEEYPQRTGSVRGEDVPFWLGLPVSPLFPHNYTTQERQIARLMLHYLANFAKSGNPNRSTQSSSSASMPTSKSFIPSKVHQDMRDHANINTPINKSKVKRSSPKSNDVIFKFVNNTSNSSRIAERIEAEAALREALNLAIIYNQHRSNGMRDKRGFYKRHLRSSMGPSPSNTNDDDDDNDNNENGHFASGNIAEAVDNDHLPFWDAYDVVNQLYLELGNKAEVQSHYRGHKLSMWLNLIPQLHKHSNINDQSMRHHQFPDDMNSKDLYEGVVRPQLQTKPPDEEDEDRVAIQAPKTTVPSKIVNATVKASPNTALVGPATTECGIDGALFVSELTTTSPTDNRSLLENENKETATASTGIIGNLRRLGSKQFQSYTTALVATVAVGCFLLVLNILIFAGIYHQREKRARDAKTKDELNTDTSKDSSLLKLNTIGDGGAMGGAGGGSGGGGGGSGGGGKTTILFGEYSCYDEKSNQTKDEKLLVELPPPDATTTWTCSTNTLDLLKTKHHQMDIGFPMGVGVVEQTDVHLHGPINSMEMATYNPLPIAVVMEPTSLQSKRNSFAGSTSHSNQQFDYAVQSSDQMSFKEIEDAVKASSEHIDRVLDDDIPEPPPPPRSFQQLQQQQQQQQQQHQQHQQQQHQQQQQGGILRQTGSGASSSTGGGKKRVHIQEISV